jgi:peroxiredoxin
LYAGVHAKKVFIVQSHSNKPFFIKRINSKNPNTVGKASSEVVASSHSVEIDVVAQGQPGTLIQSSVTLTLSTGRTLEIPIIGMVANPSEADMSTHVAAELEVGAPAPDFTALDMNGKAWKLSELRGKKNLLLTFFPKCFTGGCANHLSSLRDHQAEFDAADTQVLAVSVDPAEGEKGQIAFAKQWNLSFPLVPDTSRKLSLLYGAVQTPTDLDSRMSVLIDKSGIVRWIDRDVQVSTHGADVLAKMRELGLAK